MMQEHTVLTVQTQIQTLMRLVQPIQLVDMCKSNKPYMEHLGLQTQICVLMAMTQEQVMPTAMEFQICVK